MYVHNRCKYRACDLESYVHERQKYSPFCICKYTFHIDLLVHASGPAHMYSRGIRIYLDGIITLSYSNVSEHFELLVSA